MDAIREESVGPGVQFSAQRAGHREHDPLVLGDARRPHQQ
jgi:hypothetical protein